MKRIIRSIHAGWAFLVFGILFLICLPLFLIPVAIPAWYKLTGILNRFWAKAFFFLIFIPCSAEYRFDTRKYPNYVFCPNHFSYLDIPSMGLTKVNSIFVGKSDMEKIPLFGFMYRKLHITVNRESLKSRYSTLLQSSEALAEGKSLIIFPEGGIYTKNPPQMVRFKDGAFRAAIEQQIPVVPVTIPYNWIILPDYTFLPRRHTMKVIFHEPIVTKGLTMDHLNELKQETYRVIDEELRKLTNEN